MNDETVAHAFELVREIVKKEQNPSEVAISKHLEEIEEELTKRRLKKKGITYSKIKNGRVYRIIVEAIAIKRTCTYISETMLGKFLGKVSHGYTMDIAREIADSAIMQMKNVKLKSQKLVKCGHVWVGLYGKAIMTATKSATIQLDDVSSPGKPPQQLAESAGMKKRKLEQELLDQESKKSRSTTTSISIDTKQGGDTWKMIMDKKKKEMERKAQNTSQ